MNAWAIQTRQLTLHKWQSPVAHLAIWRDNDRPTRNDRRCQVTDRELARMHGRPLKVVTAFEPHRQFIGEPLDDF